MDDLSDLHDTVIEAIRGGAGGGTTETSVVVYQGVMGVEGRISFDGSRATDARGLTYLERKEVDKMRRELPRPLDEELEELAREHEWNLAHPREKTHSSWRYPSKLLLGVSQAEAVVLAGVAWYTASAAAFVFAMAGAIAGGILFDPDF